MTNHDRAGDEPRFTALTIVEGSDHIPEVPLEPLIASGLDSAETETRALRRDGWTPERKRLFQETPCRMRHGGALRGWTDDAGDGGRGRHDAGADEHLDFLYTVPGGEGQVTGSAHSWGCAR